MGKQYSATISIGAVMASSVNSVFGGIESRMKALGKTMSGLKKTQADIARYQGMKNKDSAAAKKLSDALKEAGVNTENLAEEQQRLARELSKAEREMAKLARRSDAIKGVGAAWKNVTSSFANDTMRLVKGVSALGLVAAGAVAGLTKLTTGFVEWADDIADAAEALNMSTEALQTWQFAASTVGVSGEQVGASFAKFSRTVAEGGDKLDETFKELGINSSRLKKLSMDDQLAVVAEAFKRYDGRVSKASLAMSLFGRSGYKMVGVLNKGKEGLDEFNKLGKETGAILDDAANAAAGEAATAMETLGVTMIGLRNTLAVQLAPALTVVAGKIGELVRGNGQRIKEWGKQLGDIVKDRLVPALATLMDKLPGLIDKVGQTAEKIWAGVNAVKDFVGGWDNLGYALLALNFAPTIVAIGQMTYALYGLGASLVAGMGPIGWAIAAVAAIGAGVYLWWQNLEKIRAWYEGASGWTRALVQVGFGIMGVAGAALHLSLVWEKVTAAAINMFEIMKAGWEAGKVGATIAADAIKAAFTAVFDWMSQRIAQIGDTFKGLWEGLKGLNPFAEDAAAPGGAGPTSSVQASVVPPSAMPPPGANVAQTNNVNVNINAPGQDGAALAGALRSELNRKPLYDADGVLVPA